MTEVLLTIPFPDDFINTLKGVSPGINLTIIPANSADISPELWGKTEVLYTSTILPGLREAPNLKWIQFHYAGIDRFIDEPIFTKEGIQITTLSGAAAPQMGEHILSMLLALGHRLPAMVAFQRKSEWPKDRFERLIPLELREQTVGIVGYGSIGRQVARLLQPFGATVLATKQDAMHPEDKGFCFEDCGDPRGDFVHRIYPPQALRSMVKECNFLVVTSPMTPSTRGMINDSVFNAMRSGTLLVDVSRGGLVDHAALLTALKNGKLAGAALDVFPEEPLPTNNPLWQMPNVIITPHISGNSSHYQERAIKLFSENLHRFLAGLPLYNLFDPARGY